MNVGRAAQEFKKVFTRDFCLISLEIAALSERRDDKPWLSTSNPHTPYRLTDRSEGTCRIWYNKKGVTWTNDVLVAHIQANPDFLGEVENQVRAGITFIRPIYERQAPVDRNTLLQFIDETLRAYPWIEAMWWIKSLDATKLGIDNSRLVALREETETLSAASDVVIRRSLEELYPALGPQAAMISLQELRDDNPPALSELQARMKEFTMIDEKFLLQPLEALTQEHNFVLDQPKVDPGVTTLQGEVAYAGKVQGVVCRVMGHGDFGKIQEGQILVSPMTAVDFLPEMKKAAAIVTDEGGITSHAAIVARELHKPCIIGTHIATKVLRDGDVVEVDAEKGMVKKV